MEKKTILVPLFFLLLISLVTQVSGAETNSPPYVFMNFEVKSRDEILLNVEISRFVMPTFFDESKFVIGFFSPTKYGIKTGDVSASCTENYVSYSLAAGSASWLIDNIEIVVVTCKFPSELENLSQISKVSLEITFFETTESSEFISGQKEDFPLDDYILNLYVVFLVPVGERHAAVLGDITFEPGLQLVHKVKAENIETPVGINSSFPNADTEPVVYYTSFKFHTHRTTMLSLVMFFWPFYVIVIVGVLLSLLLETERVALSLHILLASVLLLLTLHVQFIQATPSEITSSVAHIITIYSNIVLLLSLVLVSSYLYLGRDLRKGECLWERLKSGQKLSSVVVLLIFFIGLPILFLHDLMPSPSDFLNWKIWISFFSIPWVLIAFLLYLFKFSKLRK